FARNGWVDCTPATAGQRSSRLTSSRVTVIGAGSRGPVTPEIPTSTNPEHTFTLREGLTVLAGNKNRPETDCTAHPKDAKSSLSDFFTSTVRWRARKLCSLRTSQLAKGRPMNY